MIFPIPTSLFSAPTAVVAASSQLAPAAEEVFFDFPNTKTGQWQQYSAHVVNGFYVFPGTTVGWRIIFARLPEPRTDAVVLPQIVPAVAPIASEGAAIAAVVLPEAAGYTQYWVPVLERYRSAVLLSREWSVTFHKQANTYEVCPEGEPCGCS